MASAYVFEIVTHCRTPRVRLWLPTDPIPARLAGEVGNRGIFEGRAEMPGGAPITGTWVGVPDLPAGYDSVALDLHGSSGIAEITSPLERACGKDHGARFGIALRPHSEATHVLAVTFIATGRSVKLPPLAAKRSFDVLSVRVPVPAPVGAADHACKGVLLAELERVPRAVMDALEAGKAEALTLSPDARGIDRLGPFEPTGPASGRMAFTLTETADDLHQMVLTARCLEDHRFVTATAPAFVHQGHPRVELVGPVAARALPAEPPARFRIGPFDGLEPGQADLVQAAFGDLRRLGQPYKGPPWIFQLRVQPYRRADGSVNDTVPRRRRAGFAVTEGGDLGVVVAADEAHPHLEYAHVDKGHFQPRRPLRRAGNPFLPADSTTGSTVIVVRGAGIEEPVELPGRGVVFYLDEHELTNAHDGLLRGLDTASDHCGTPLLMALHVLAPCGCVSRLELEPRAHPQLQLASGFRPLAVQR